MLQLKTVHDARRTRALPSSTRLHAHGPLAARRDNGTTSTAAGGGCGLTARLVGVGSPRDTVQVRARPPKVLPSGPAAATKASTTPGDAQVMAPRAAGGPATKVVVEVVAALAQEGEQEATASGETAKPAAFVDAPRRRPCRTQSHDFELVFPAGPGFDAAEAPSLRSPADEDDWEFLSLEQGEDVSRRNSTGAADGTSAVHAATSAAAPLAVAA
ncbi:hypothetical protein DMC30DRAFT_414968 [Rhodotorula diobovata]|uniref:Uncharacterized protein n=1 Tax=Rhodotorula diobovata TaxID=5288 RepID=A0A5C5G0C9_9BASI|nr:hypothetical protein DMC30DRAFT_414968 [Rhodotorula diobovata]